MRLPLVSRKRYEAVKAERDELDAKLAEAIRWHRETARERDEARRWELQARRADPTDFRHRLRQMGRQLERCLGVGEHR